MLNSLFYLIPLLGLTLPVAASPPAGQINVFANGKQVGKALITFEIGGVTSGGPKGQSTLSFRRKGPESFLLVDYTTYKYHDRAVDAEVKAEHDGLLAGIAEFSVHKRLGDKDEIVICDLGGDFKDPSKGVDWVFTWDGAEGVKTEICPEEKNGITLNCKGDKGFKPRCMSPL
ncbi:uncharacterized protein MKK02DRAFT_41168 [Dioszegia hungarica]|uniref:Uncharacterized protein n=1 Tax=Dioszegia hungarica TaxID=4972 RepID=A0AA38H2S7_9TREE|nr:uncharacterized protein MKK02DRAFT_41168 [Dioszegia hungarica]KAI9632855.1 hypothetical protein MKK02DRAFT_41168 [Dioszegia hungarica]